METKTITTSTKDNIKPGVQTTEFLLTMLVSIYTVMQSFISNLPPTIAAIVVASVVCVYTIMRTIVKIKNPDYVPPELPIGSGKMTSTTTTVTTPTPLID